MDNAGKILTMSEITHDSTDASRSLSFIESYLHGGSYYLPELWVNSSVGSFTTSGSSISISNDITELTANNSTLSHYDQLAIGTQYTGSTSLGYLGADRACFHFASGCNVSSSVSSQVYEIQNGFSKRSLFEFEGSMYYLYLNATIEKSNPFVNVSMQIEPLNSTTSGVDYVFLQVFNAGNNNPFYAGSL